MRVLSKSTVMVLFCCVALGWASAAWAKAPTAEQVERVAQQIEASLLKGDPKVFAAAFDNSRFLDRMVGKFKLEPQERAQFLRGMLLGDALGKQFVTNNNNGGSYRLLRVRPVDGKPRALFRMVQDSSAVNYHDMVFELNGKGDPVIVDIEAYVSGEMVSQTVRRTVLPQLVSMKQSRLSKLFKAESLYVKHEADVHAIIADARTGNNRSALDRYNKLPKPLQEDLLVMMTAMRAAQQMGFDSKEYEELSARFSKVHGNGSNAELVRIDPLLFQNKFREALVEVNKLDKRVGGDPYLETMRSSIYLELGEQDKAKAAVERGVKAEPDLPEMYWAELGYALVTEDHERTLRTIIKLEEQFGIPFLEDFTGVADYEAFAKSPQHDAWKARVAKNK